MTGRKCYRFISVTHAADLILFLGLSCRDNLLELDLYFEEMSTQIIQQVPAYDEESLFGMLLTFYLL